MGFGPFVLLSLFYAVIGVRVVGQLVANRRDIFDRRFTLGDRAMVDQAAFFVLVPISVALHELGHAAAIGAFGGTVESWGYYLFAGYVGFNPRGFTDPQLVLVAAAGSAVNVLLGALALGVVFVRRTPMRAAYNELLLQFTVLSLLNALIVYPALDLTSGLNGDWSQVYRGGAPRLAAAILAVHAAILVAGVAALRSDRVGRRIAALTGVPPGSRRRPLGGVRRAEAAELPADGPDRTLLEAADRVAAGWPTPVESTVQRRAEGALLLVAWEGGGAVRSVSVWVPRGGDAELAGAVAANGAAPIRRPLARLPAADADRLTIALRVAMETVATWEGGTTGY